MSLFDDDDVGSSVSSTEGDLNETVVPMSTVRTGGVCVKTEAKTNGPRTGLEDVHRFTLSVEETQRAEERRRVEASKRLLLSTDGGLIPNSCGGPSSQERSRFGSSIAEALRLRRETRERVLLQRILRQRREEEGNEDLAEKDMEVGVFITPQYLSALKRQRSTRAASPGGLAKQAENMEDMDPLELYVQELEERRRVVGKKDHDSSDVGTNRNDGGRDQDMGLRVHSAQVVSGNKQPEHVERSGVTGIPCGHDVVYSVKASSCAWVPTGTNGAVIGVSGAAAPASPSPTENSATPQEALQEVRWRRQKPRADRSFIESAATRFNRRSMDRFV